MSASPPSAPHLPLSYRPRKSPKQLRSRELVRAVTTATVEVLRKGEPLTTKAVAKRAGVSVGSLYQYFPTKEALVAAVVEHHLDAIVRALMSASESVHGRPVEEMAKALIDAFLDVKITFAAEGSALRSIVAAPSRRAMVRDALGKIEAHVAVAVATAPDAPPDAARFTAIALTAVEAIVDRTLESDPAELLEPTFRDELYALTLGYWRTRKARSPTATLAE